MSDQFARRLAKYVIKNVVGLNDGDCKGSGCYGTVYKVTVNGIPRIAKRLLDILQTPDVRPSERQGIKDRFHYECLLLSKLNHPNVVQFVGVQLDPEPLLIMESLHMDLDKFLNIEREIPLSIKLSILLDISSGLLHLHTLEEQIIHRDLTPSNVLLTTDLRAKIADLGVSKLLYNYPQREMVHTKCPGAMAYMPPEALGENPMCDSTLDIFSFGQLTLYAANQQFPEVFTVPVNDDTRDTLQLALQNGELELLKRKRWINMLEENHCLLDVIQQCLQDEPKKRPSAKYVNSAMKTLCVIHPKSLPDLTIVWGGKGKEEVIDQHEMNREQEIIHQRELQQKEATICELEDQLANKRAAVVELEEEVAQLQEEKDKLSDLLQAQAKSLDSMKNDIALFQTHASELIDGIGEKSTEAENLKSEQERLNKRCDELKNELEARKFEAQTYKADFEEERRDREVAAGRKEVEISQYRDRILQLEDLVRSLKEEKQSSDKSLHEFKHGKSHDHRMTKLERELKSVNEKLQLAENYKTLKQQREENEQKFYSDHLVGLLRRCNVDVPSPAEVLQYQLPQPGPATFHPQHLPRPPPPQLNYQDQHNPPSIPQPKFSPPHHGAISGYSSEPRFDAHYQRQHPMASAAGPYNPQPNTQSKPYPYPFEGLQHPQQGCASGYHHQRQDIMGKMRLYHSDSTVDKNYPHGYGGYTSNPIQPPYYRWHSDEQYYSEGRQQMKLPQSRYVPQQHMEHATLGGVLGSPEYPKTDRNKLSPSESLPIMLEMPREQCGSDSSEEGPGNITKEVQQRAKEVIEETDANREIKTDIQKPFDPNLVCPMCKKNFRIGEIQKFRRHAEKCGEGKK